MSSQTIEINLWLQDALLEFMSDYAKYESRDERGFMNAEVGYGRINCFRSEHPARNGFTAQSHFRKEYSIGEAMALYVKYEGKAPEYEG